MIWFLKFFKKKQSLALDFKANIAPIRSNWTIAWIVNKVYTIIKIGILSIQKQRKTQERYGGLRLSN